MAQASIPEKVPYRARRRTARDILAEMRREWTAYLFNAPGLVLFAVFTVYAVSVAFWLSFQDWDSIKNAGAILIGDYSNGNDAVLVRHNLALAQIPGKRVLLVEKTVSQYLFERAMTLNNQAGDLKRVKYVNTSDSDIAGAFLSDTSQEAVVTWKPLVSQILKGKGIATPSATGDLYVRLVVTLPDNPDDELKRFAEGWQTSYDPRAKLRS